MTRKMDAYDTAMRWLWNIDPAHLRLDLFGQQITKDIWEQKYRYEDEKSSDETFWRICQGVIRDDVEKSLLYQTHAAMTAGLLIPGGRINAGAGTTKAVTLHNCYVSGTVEDSMEGIHKALGETMFTLKTGGGIGTDFSTLRPRGARLKLLGSGAYSSGAVSFMHVWNAASGTIMSAGSRRGAMMATLRCDHPDLLEFIEAKHTQGQLTNFNISVLVTKEFMHAVKENQEWWLFSEHRHADPDKVRFHASHPKDPKKEIHVYWAGPAREIWDRILRSTYVYAEPGVIFIDRINEMNNLYYCEQISCTNPCGEQPLPPWGACNLGHVNVARMVFNPFKQDASFSFELLRKIVKVAVGFLDCVIDVSSHPIREQAQEQYSKRRIGLGMSGLANAIDMLGLTYGTPEAVDFASQLQQQICFAAYEASIELAEKHGSFPLYREEYQEGKFIQRLPEAMQRKIKKHGIRNSLLLTQAPVGTGSLWFGNISSGIEPVFSHTIKRKVLQPDNTWKPYLAFDYGALLWDSLRFGEPLPRNMITSQELSVRAHVDMQAAVQKWTDASISKTINCPEEMSFEDFRDVYTYAYEKGCKGITTYRPNDIAAKIRGSVLDVAKNEGSPVAPNLSAATITNHPIGGSKGKGETRKMTEDEVSNIIPLNTHEEAEPTLDPRPKVLSGKTYQLKWPHREAAIYMTINDHDGSPHEVLFTSRSMQDMQWMIALGRMLAAMLRLQIDVHFICDELSEVRDAYEGGSWVEGKQYGSVVALIGETLRRHLEGHANGGSLVAVAATKESTERQGTANFSPMTARVCPKCSGSSLQRIEGCDKCTSCGYSRC